MNKRHKRSDYKICEFCGCALDVGESCDCKQSLQSKASKPDKITYIFNKPTRKGGIAV